MNSTECTTFIERFQNALQIMCGGNRPSLKLCTSWIEKNEEDYDEFQEWVMCNTSAKWSQGVVTIDAAIVWAKTPEEGTSIC